MKIEYVSKKFSRSSREIIDHANQIIEEYEDAGFDLSLRQLYYQFVSRSLIPNTQTDYKRLGSIINDARLAGLISWTAISDRTRMMRGNTHWEDPKELLLAAADSPFFDRWEGYAERYQVWIEKDALVDVIAGPCYDLDVEFFSCRGYVSQSEMWAAGTKIGAKLRRGVSTVVFHFGDHDPSGIDMTRDIQERLSLFARRDVEVVRVALNIDQVQAYNLPPNPAKTTDSRYASYISQYGDESWELDALDPSVIVDLVRGSIEPHIDPAIMSRIERKERQLKNKMSQFVEGWEG